MGDKWFDELQMPQKNKGKICGISILFSQHAKNQSWVSVLTKLTFKKATALRTYNPK